MHASLMSVLPEKGAGGAFRVSGFQSLVDQETEGPDGPYFVRLTAVSTKSSAICQPPESIFPPSPFHLPTTLLQSARRPLPSAVPYRLSRR